MLKPASDPKAPAPSIPSTRIFRRLLYMLRPHWGTIALAVVLLLLSLPAELFPGLTWMYVTDELIITHKTAEPSWFIRSLRSCFGEMFSLHGLITGRLHLLFSAVTWMFAIYLLSEVFGTLSAYLMNIVAQKFMLTVRNEVYHKLQCQSLAYLQRQRLGDLMSRAMGDVDELQSFLVNSIDQIVGDGLQWLVTVVLVMLLSWQVSTASLAPLVVVYFLLRIFNRKVAPIYKAARESGRCRDAPAGKSGRRGGDQDLWPRATGRPALSRGNRDLLRSAGEGNSRSQHVFSNHPDRGLSQQSADVGCGRSIRF